MDIVVWLNRLVKYIGVLGFALSVINLCLTLYFRRTKLTGSDGIVVVRPPKYSTGFVEITIVNKSALPVSIHSATLIAFGAEFASSHVREVATMNPNKPNATTHALASKLPVFLAGYASQRMSIQFDRRAQSEQSLRLPAEDSHSGPAATYPISLTLYTSRRPQTIEIEAKQESFEDWARSVVYGKDF